MLIVTDETIEAMKRYGGSFVQQLAVLYMYADAENRAILETAFMKYFDNYGELARQRGPK